MSGGENHHRGRPKMSRVVSFYFASPVDLEGKTADLLRKELENPETPLTQFGTEGFVLWLTGAPGAPLRAILASLEALGWARTSES